MACVPSVSYTHLDVYKRQVHHQGGEVLGVGGLAAARFAEGDHVGVGDRDGVVEHPAERVGVEAVSYTHLDVYKRQADE